MPYLTHLYRFLVVRFAANYWDPFALLIDLWIDLGTRIEVNRRFAARRDRRLKGMFRHKYAGCRFRFLRFNFKMFRVNWVLTYRAYPWWIRVAVVWVVLSPLTALLSPPWLAATLLVTKLNGLKPFLAKTLDAVDDSPITTKIKEDRFGGRSGYSPKVIWRACLASYVLGMPSTNALIRRLEEDPRLPETCGFGETLPHRTTFNRFFTRLADYQDLVDKCLADLAHQFREMLPDLGEKVAVDSTPVRSHSHPKRKGKLSRKTSDPQASWTAKPSDRRKGEKDWFWGYNLHLMVDAVYGIPLYSYTTTASKHDSPELPRLRDGAKELLSWLNPKRVVADRGYDSVANHEAVLDRGGVLISPVRLPLSDDKIHEGIYTVKGEPTCMGVVPMVYGRSDPHLGHLYRRRREGCHLLGKKGRRYCNQEFWVNRSDNVRLFGPIRRDSAEWDGLYALRQSVERVFKSLKENRRLERDSFRGLRRVDLHAAVSVLGFAATVLVKLRA